MSQVSTDKPDILYHNVLDYIFSDFLRHRQWGGTPLQMNSLLEPQLFKHFVMLYHFPCKAVNRGLQHPFYTMNPPYTLFISQVLDL